MAQFSVNAQRFDPYKNFKFRVKWDGRYVAGVSKVGALKRTTEVVKHREGGDPEHQPQVARAHRVRGDHARARRHPRHRVRAVGEQGLELRLRARRGDLAARISARTSSSRSTTRPASSPSPTRSSAAGCRSTRRCPTSTPTPTPSRSSTSSWRTRAGSATTTSSSRPSRASPNQRGDARCRLATPLPSSACGNEGSTSRPSGVHCSFSAPQRTRRPRRAMTTPPRWRSGCGTPACLPCEPISSARRSTRWRAARSAGRTWNSS